MIIPVQGKSSQIKEILDQDHCYTKYLFDWD